MIRRPPRSTRTDTLFPYTTLFRSAVVAHAVRRREVPAAGETIQHVADVADQGARQRRRGDPALGRLHLQPAVPVLRQQGQETVVAVLADAPRSEERRVGKECVSTCRSRWSPYH